MSTKANSRFFVGIFMLISLVAVIGAAIALAGDPYGKRAPMIIQQKADAFDAQPVASFLRGPDYTQVAVYFEPIDAIVPSRITVVANGVDYTFFRREANYGTRVVAPPAVGAMPNP
tara:strand:+ start:540 stop:887 length:348 start_codon:yes stop_codon:yes gene_type:complete